MLSPTENASLVVTLFNWLLYFEPGTQSNQEDKDFWLLTDFHDLYASWSVTQSFLKREVHFKVGW